MKTTATRLRKALCAILAAALAATLAPGAITGAPAGPLADLAGPSAAYADGPITASPTGVYGRILTPSETGDTCNWLEIAQNGGYSLVVRTNFINVASSGYGNPAFQYVNYGPNNRYSDSNVRSRINAWFNGAAAGDQLPSSARLRDYTVMNDALYTLGQPNTYAASAGGLSKPNPYKARTGSDVAFALSFGEAANFLSLSHLVRLGGGMHTSSNVAISNFSKMAPLPSDKFYGMWLRTTGDTNIPSACTLDIGYYAGANGRAWQYMISFEDNARGYAYPALWVESTIFRPSSFNVTYYPNGGSGVARTYPVAPGSVHIVSDQGYVGGAYKQFLYWNTRPDGYGTTYRNGDAIMVSCDTQLYAIWATVDPTYSITYYPNGGSGSARTYQVYVNSYHYVSDQGFTWSGRQPAGWNTRPDGGGTQYQNGSAILVTGNIQLYAQWGPAQPTSFCITYEPNGGSGPARTYTMNANYYHYVFDQGYTWANHTFTGWNTRADGGGTAYQNGSPLLMTSNVTLYAQWRELPAPTYTVTYYANGDSGMVRTHSAAANSTHYVFDQGFAWAGYTQNGWNTRPDGTGTQYQNGAAIVVTGNVYLYAQWRATPPPTYTVTYYPNGGSGTARTYSVNANSTHYVFDQGFTMAGSAQNGWNTISNGTGAAYQNGSAIVVTGDVNLYAQWRATPPPNYTVTYYPNGGSGTARSYTLNANSTHYVFDQGYTLSNQTQNGWNTRPDGAGIQYQNGAAITMTGDVFLYAQWVRSDSSITYMPNGGFGQSFVDYGTNRNFEIKPCPFVGDNAVFMYWNTSPDGYGATIPVGTALMNFYGNLTLYAIWRTGI